MQASALQVSAGRVSTYRCLILVLCGTASFAYGANSGPVENSDGHRLETVARGLHHPWSVAQLPGGDFLVTERRGRLLHIAIDGNISTISGVPKTWVAGQGGFFDVVLHPDFSDNALVYLSYADGTDSANSTAIFRARLRNGALVDGRRILKVSPQKDTPQHYGGRLAFMPDGTLLVTSGEGFDYREAAQALDNEMGKVLRINDDGSVPSDNPFSEAGSERVWTYGHRNPQGLVIDNASGRIFLHEHGPRGGDELNRLRPGNNYGWPAITHGVDYSGAYVSPFSEAPGMQQPDWVWTPSIAPSGLALYDGQRYPQWRGDLFVGALVDRELRRLVVRQGTVIAERALFTQLDERIRDVRAAPDGYLYLLTDSEDGKLLRVVPGAAR